MNQEYAGYEALKGWSAETFMNPSPQEKAYYNLEFAAVPLKGERVLEIGFGNGSLLGWLREQGAEVYGTEISEQGRRLAAQHGITVLDADLSVPAPLKGMFGVIAIFDVLEHLTYAQISDVLDKAATLLKTGGIIVARFPNGASPFGRLHQNDDITHVSTLTEGRIRQIMFGKPFSMERAGDSAVEFYGSMPVRLAKRARAVVRRLLERFVSGLYGMNLAFHPNLTIVLRRH